MQSIQTQKINKHPFFLKSNIFHATIEVFSTLALIIGILLCVLNSAYAVELLCSNRPEDSSMNKDEFSVAMVKGAAISLADMPKLFSAAYQNRSGDSIRVCVLPESNAATKEMLSSLEINRQKFRSLLNHQGKENDSREIKLVSNELEMLRCVEEVYPAVGYVRHVSDAHQELGCF